MTEYRQMKVLRPSINIETLKDGRGRIATCVPQDKIVEFNLTFDPPECSP